MKTSRGVRKGTAEQRQSSLNYARRLFNRALRTSGYLIVLLAFAFLVRITYQSAAEIPSINWLSPVVLAGIIFSIGLYLGGLFATGVAWHLLLCAAGQPSKIRMALGIFLAAQGGKYLPGNIVHLAGRVALARRYGLEPRRVIGTLTAEIVLSGLAALSVVAIAQGLSVNPLPFPHAPWGVYASAGVCGLGVIGWHHLRSNGSSIADVGGHLQALAVCWCLYIVGFAAMGTAAWVVAILVIATVQTGTYFLLEGAFAAAWLIGFITPGAPGGIGVREAVLIALLTSSLDAGPALGIALLLRLISALGDSIGFTLAMLDLRLRGRAEQPISDSNATDEPRT